MIMALEIFFEQGPHRYPHPLVCMFSMRSLNNKINHLHEKALRIAYKDELSDFETMLEKNLAVTIHIKHL